MEFDFNITNRVQLQRVKSLPDVQQGVSLCLHELDTAFKNILKNIIAIDTVSKQMAPGNEWGKFYSQDACITVLNASNSEIKDGLNNILGTIDTLKEIQNFLSELQD
jgi:hypothetical protein